MAATQRPATQEALTEPSGERPLWRELPSWFLIGKEDRIIPAELQHYMAERVGAQRTVEALPGASHAAAVSQPEATADLIPGGGDAARRCLSHKPGRSFRPVLTTGRNERQSGLEGEEMFRSTVFPTTLRKAEHLHDVERTGESEWTPWIAILGLVLFFAAVGSLMLALVEAAAHLIARAATPDEKAPLPGLFLLFRQAVYGFRQMAE